MRHAPPGDHSADDVRDKPRGAGAAPKRQSLQPQTGITPRTFWKAAAWHLARSADGKSPRAMFRSVAETIIEDIRDQADGAVAAPLGSTLRAITAASRVAVAAEKSGIMLDFANRMAAAQATADPRQLAGILRAIKEQRRAALAVASRNAVRERHEKRQAVLQGGKAQRPRGSGGSRRPRKPRW
jgi:hypothetical protein